MKRAVIIPSLVALTALAACRADSGIPDYSSHAQLKNRTNPNGESLPGPIPFVPGTPRLGIGLFYEGRTTKAIALNGASTHYYIFTISGSNALTYAQEADTERVEGKLSDKITLKGTPFWGGGIIWDQPTDLTGWTTMVIALKSADPGFKDVAIRTKDTAEHTVQAGAYGYINDGMWHVLEIPFADFMGLDLSKVTSPLILGGTGGSSGEVLLVDSVFFTKD